MSDLVPAAQPPLHRRDIHRFYYNKSLQQQGFEWRLGEVAHDIRSDIRRVGAAIVQQQERAAKQHGADAVALRGELGAMKQQDAANAAKLQEAISASAQMLKQGLQDQKQAIERMGGAITDQLTSVRWELAQQQGTLQSILAVLRTSRSNECRQLIEQGDTNIRAGYIEEARERYTLAAVQDNTNMLLWQQLGIIAVARGEFGEAEAHFKKAVAFTPANQQRLRAMARTHLARLYYASERWPEAAQALRAALDDDPTAAKNWYDLAVVAAAEGNGADGVQALDRAIQLDPSFYAYALTDPELDPIRADVHALLLDELPRRVTEAVRAPATAVLALLERVAAAEHDLGVPLAGTAAAAARELAMAEVPSFVPAVRQTIAELDRAATRTIEEVRTAARSLAARSLLPWSEPAEPESEVTYRVGETAVVTFRVRAAPATVRDLQRRMNAAARWYVPHSSRMRAWERFGQEVARINAPYKADRATWDAEQERRRARLVAIGNGELDRG